MPTVPVSSPTVAIIGGGPAGLMAAEEISKHGIQVDLYDAMPSVGRKFLMAGKSGLNLTHAEPLESFLSRYGARRAVLEPIITAFPPQALREWAKVLGITTFVGSSKRVFPTEMKAAPLLRAWLHRLRVMGVRFHMRHRWLGFDSNGCLRFMTPDGETVISATATVLALGGGSWAQLGSTGAWVPILQQAGVTVTPLQPSNCGFEVTWSSHLREHFAGEPVKSVTISFTDSAGEVQRKQGDFVITHYGLEGSLVYAFAAAVRDVIGKAGRATLYLDLLPALSQAHISEKLTQPRGKRSLAEHLRKQIGIRGVKAALLYEVATQETLADPHQLAAMIKTLPVVCERPRPIDEAISTAGGVSFDALDAQLMLMKLPGVFCAGEMLDWDAPTGGYLLTACFASGYIAGQGVVNWLAKREPIQT
jgi:uncharacterized flavoprotein (TIGR03862 family)